MWDNRQTMHRVRRYDQSQPRDMRRATVAGTEPTVAQQAAAEFSLSSRPSEARAGIHNHDRALPRRLQPQLTLTTRFCGYRSPPSRGRQGKMRRPQLRVPGFVRKHADVYPDFAQRPGIFFFDIAAEDQIGIGVTMQPAIVLDFAFELACGPAGIAQRQDRMLRPGALGDGFQNIDRGGQAYLVVDPQCRILNEKIA